MRSERLPVPARRAAPVRVAFSLTLAAFMLLTGLFAGSNATAARDAERDRPQASAAAARFGPAMLTALNRERSRRGLPRVRSDRRMAGTAAAHSRDMARRGYFSHGAWSGRVARASRSAKSIGEVIGQMGSSSPGREASAMVRAWLNSPSHRAVLLSRVYRRIGMGRATAQRGGATVAIWTVDWASAR